MDLLKALWSDENGFVVTAEAVLLGTVGVIGATVGMKMAVTSVDRELRESAYAFRSLDQSYGYKGFCSCRAFTAGSRYIQPPVKKSLRELRELEERGERAVRDRERELDRLRRNRERELDRRRRDDDRRGKHDDRDRRNRRRDDRGNEQSEELKI